METPGDAGRKEHAIECILEEYYVTRGQAQACVDAYDLFEQRPRVLANAVNDMLHVQVSGSPSYLATPEHIICFVHYIDRLALSVHEELEHSLRTSSSPNYIDDSDDLLRGSCLSWYSMFSNVLDPDEELDVGESAFCMSDAVDELASHYTAILRELESSSSILDAVTGTSSNDVDFINRSECISVPLFHSVVGRGFPELSERAYDTAYEQFSDHLAGTGFRLQLTGSFYSDAERHYKLLVHDVALDPLKSLARLNETPSDDSQENRRKILLSYVQRELARDCAYSPCSTRLTAGELFEFLERQSATLSQLAIDMDDSSFATRARLERQIFDMASKDQTWLELMLTK